MHKSSAKLHCKFCFAGIQITLVPVDTDSLTGKKIYGDPRWRSSNGLDICLQLDASGTITNALGDHFGFNSHRPNLRDLAESLDELIRLS